MHKGSHQKNSKGYDNKKLSENWVSFEIPNIVLIPVLLQRSLMHSNSAQFSRTIIHCALGEDLNEKLPEPSVSYIFYDSQFIKAGIIEQKAQLCRNSVHIENNKGPRNVVIAKNSK